MRRMKLYKLLRTTAAFTVFGVAVAGGLLFIKSRPDLTQDAAALTDAAQTEGLKITARWGLAVKDIVVEGRRRTEIDHLLAAMRVRQGDAILGLNMAETRTRIEALPWVDKAVVERRFPHTLHIAIEERQPAALWRRDASLVLVDVKGQVIRDNIDAFMGLPRISGAGAPERIGELLTIFAGQPALSERVLAAHLMSDRRWNVRILIGDKDRNLTATVRLPEDAPEAAWNRLAALDKTQGLLKRDLDMIDMRYEGRLIVHVRGAEDPAQDDLKTKVVLQGRPT